MDIGTPELVIILVIVLLVFGPGRIVKLAGELGSSLRQFREGLASHSDTESDKPDENKPPDA